MALSPSFRSLAEKSLARAKQEFEANDPVRLRYAALDLRDALEALTYDRAKAFKDDIPPADYKTWQPRKLMAVLVSFDPSIGETSTLSIGVEKEYGEPAPPENMKLLGTDHVLSLAHLKKHYDAVGSYLHMPTLEQLQSGKSPDLDKLRGRCKTVIELVETILSSSVWNVNIGRITKLDKCMNEDCNKPVRKRVPSNKDSFDAQCFECSAEYKITLTGSGKAEWQPKQEDVPCSTEGCTEVFRLWPHQLKIGTS